MKHFEEFNSELRKMFGFDFIETLFNLDKSYGTDNLDMNEVTIEKFIEMKVGKVYLERLKSSKGEEYYSWTNLLLANYHYYKHHQKRFELTPDLTKLLLQTDMKDVDVAFVKLPFPSIYLSFPEGMFESNVNEKSYHVDGVYLHQYNLSYHSKNELERMLGKGIVSFIQMTIVANNKEDGSIYGSVNLRFKKGNVLEQLEENYKRAKTQFPKLASDVFVLVLNTLFYLQSDKVDVEYMEHPNNVLVMKKSSGNTNSVNKSYYRVGNKIVIDSALKSKLKEYEKQTNEIERDYKWLVRGHWRKQVHGKGRQERKLIWIEPYMKGNKEGQLIEKNYELRK